MTGAWHPDPTGRHELRWWDGSSWTDHVSDHGTAGTDPLVPPPAPHAPAPPPAPPHAPTLTMPATATSLPMAEATGSPGPRRPVWIWVAVAAVAAVGIAGGVLMSLRGDGSSSSEATAAERDDEADDEHGTVTVAPTTAATVAPTTATTVAASTVPLSVPTTAAPTTAVPTTVAPTTAAPTTAAPATTLHLATVDDLLAALPPAAELPAGWTPTGEGPDTAPTSSTAPDVWFCGGPDDVGRAQAAGATSIVWGEVAWFEPNGWAGVDLYAFPTEAAASAFMAQTLATASACPGGWSYTMPEGEGEGQFDGFSEGYGDGVVVWSFTDSVSASPIAPAGTNEAFSVVVSSSWSTNFESWDYGGVTTSVVQYERHGRAVEVVYLGGDCCLTGFGDVDPSSDTIPTAADAAVAADTMRAGIVSRLVSLGVV